MAQHDVPLQLMEIPSCISENVKQLENIFTQMRINAKIPCFSTICRRKILSIFQARRKVSFLSSPDNMCDEDYNNHL